MTLDARSFQWMEDEYGITKDQYWRAAAAHELGHAILTAYSQSIELSHIELAPRQSKGAAVTYSRRMRGWPEPDPMEKAVSLNAGTIAERHWLQRVERCWTPRMERLLTHSAQGDMADLSRLGLSGRQRSQAEREAGHAIDRYWSGLESALPKLMKRGRLTGRELSRFVR